MSVLIKGMEMPKNCSCCRMEIDETDYCLGYNCAITRNRTDSARKTRVRNDCPLVPVPAHGRLIDGDVAEAICFTNEDADGKDFYDGILYAADFISQQPTIIQAEEGET